MNYRELGHAGWRVSTVIFGAWAIGSAWGDVEDRESLAALHKAVDLGVNSNQNATSTVTNAAGTFTVNGTRSNMHEVTVDGATNINTGNNSGLLVTVNPDALAEVKVLTSNYQAEYGRAGGGFVQPTTKSGTNDFHGTVRYFRRHESLNANNFFNNGGYDIGGPVYLPRFGEGARYLQLRFEFFNIFNHPQFTSVNAGAITVTPGSTMPVFNLRGSTGCAATNVTGTCFGEFSAARDPRIIQLAAKLYF